VSVAAAAIAVAACDPNLPGAPIVYDTGTFVPLDPSPSPEGEPGVFTTADVKAVLRSLPANAPFEWFGGMAETKAANTLNSWGDFPSEPEECAAFYHLQLLRFEHDWRSSVDDVIISSSLVDRVGTGPDDDRYLATVSVRVLDDPDRGTEAVKDLVDLTEPCADGLQVRSSLDWNMLTATAVEPIPELTDASETLTSAGFRADTDAAFHAPQAVWVWAATGNVVVLIDYEIDPDEPASSDAHAQEVATSVIDAFAKAAG